MCGAHREAWARCSCTAGSEQCRACSVAGEHGRDYLKYHQQVPAGGKGGTFEHTVGKDSGKGLTSKGRRWLELFKRTGLVISECPLQPSVLANLKSA